jgi:uncharacterized protein YcaQ
LTRPLSLERLKGLAVSNSLGKQSSLAAAINRLGFVQADPIRSPARAQDLILRQRVKNYTAGDLERCYSSLGIEEDVLYAYGFLPYENWQLMHPREVAESSEAERKILSLVKRLGEVHPRDLEPHFGKERTINAWGGYSKTTTRALETLHYRGLLRVAGRKDGIKIYTIAPRLEQHLEPTERLEKLALLIANILSPIPEVTLNAVLNHLRYCAPTLLERRAVTKRLLSSGQLVSLLIEGMQYIYPAEMVSQRLEEPEAVRFLAPFDPIVWDRRRFEHLWHWPYRFEAYTPPAKRQFGYYALPILWANDVVGWANISVTERKRLVVDAGFVHAKTKRDRHFKEGFALEVDRFEAFLGLTS